MNAPRTGCGTDANAAGVADRWPISWTTKAGDITASISCLDNSRKILLSTMPDGHPSGPAAAMAGTPAAAMAGIPAAAMAGTPAAATAGAPAAAMPATPPAANGNGNASAGFLCACPEEPCGKKSEQKAVNISKTKKIIIEIHIRSDVPCIVRSTRTRRTKPNVSLLRFRH